MNAKQWLITGMTLLSFLGCTDSKPTPSTNTENSDEVAHKPVSESPTSQDTSSGGHISLKSLKLRILELKQRSSNGKVLENLPYISCEIPAAWQPDPCIKNKFIVPAGVGGVMYETHVTISIPTRERILLKSLSSTE